MIINGKKYRLRRWVKNTVSFIAKATVSIFLSLLLLYGLMCAFTITHYQRLEYYNSLIREGK